MEKASEILTSLEADNVAVIKGDLDAGNAKQGPFNVIHINGAVDTVAPALFDQLADGGRLTCVIGNNPGVATLYTKEAGTVYSQSLFDAEVPKLSVMAPAGGFQF
mgnify:CR=1 FL=1